MAPFFRFSRSRSFRLLHPIFRIYTEYQPERHVVAIRQLQNYIRNLPRIAFRTPFEASQHLEYRTDRCFVLRQQLRRILTSAPCPVGANTSRLQSADLDPERRNFHRQRIAEAAYGSFGRVIGSITANRDTPTDRRHLKNVAALLFAHHRDGGACRVHHAVKAGVNDGLEGC